MSDYSSLHGRQSHEHIIKAHREVDRKNYEKAHKYLRHAHRAFNRHLDYLETSKAPSAFILSETSHFKNKYNHVLNRIPEEHGGTKKIEKSDHEACEKCKKSGMEKGCGCGYMNKEKLNKNEMVSISPPRADKRYDYVHYNKLHPEDRVAAEKKFGLKDIGQYKYPVDKMGGRLVHATRVKHGESSVPQATSSIKPEHQQNMPVRIHSGEHAGKFGVIASPSPYHPNKIAVQVGPESWDKVHVDHSQIEPSQGKIKKAIAALFDIYERLNKSNWEYGKKKDKNYTPSYVGELHPTKPYIGVEHPRYGLTWEYTKPEARETDRVLSDPKVKEAILKMAPSSHRRLLEGIYNHIQQDPDRHLVVTPVGLDEAKRPIKNAQGEEIHRMRARHLKSLYTRPFDHEIEYRGSSHPRGGGITIDMDRHSTYRGQGQEPTVFHFGALSKKKQM